MKVLVSTFTYAPNIDGVAEAARVMVANFRDAGHDVAIATSKRTDSNCKSSDSDNIHRFEIQGSPELGSNFIGDCQSYINFIVNYDPDVIIIHCWDTWSSELLNRILDRIRAKKILLSHGYASHIIDLSILPRGLFKWFRRLPHLCSLPYRIRLYDKVVFLSHKTDWGRFFDARVARLTGARNTTVIPNGVPELPTTISGEFREKHKIGDGILFLCIANYFKGKNQSLALQAFAKAALINSTLVFIGSKLGDYGKYVINMWQDLQSSGACGRVIFLEGLGREETLSALCDCDVKILPSNAETQPIVLLEAMAAATPFISTRTGCVEELKGGVIVRNEREMAGAMRFLAESPQERCRLGNEGRQDYEVHYSLEITSKAWIDILEQI